MAKQFTVDVVTKLHADKLEIVESDVLGDPGPNEIKVGFGNAVPEHRALEILNAWRWLWNGVRDRALLDGPFSGAILISGSDIDKLNEEDRRTSSTVGDYFPADVLIGIGANVANSPLTGSNFTTRIESGFTKLSDYARENFFKTN